MKAKRTCSKYKNKMSNNNNSFGDTRLTKVFVGGLAWETRKETVREHFEKFGEILEAVIISDKVTGRSKGYGFVTFKEAEAAKKACEDPSVIIKGRRANCNLASLGARRPRSSSPPAPAPAPLPLGNQVQVPCQWYYPVAPAPAPAPAPASPFHHPLPFYGYTPTYIATDINYNYNQKVSYGNGSSGGYMNGHHVYPSQSQAAMAMYPPHPVYHFHPTQTMGMGVPAHIIHPFSFSFSHTAPIHHS